MFLPLLECFLERSFYYGAQFSDSIFLNTYSFEAISFQSGCKFGKQEKRLPGTKSGERGGWGTADV
jgi:hypothetical protein